MGGNNFISQIEQFAPIIMRASQQNGPGGWPGTPPFIGSWPSGIPPFMIPNRQGAMLGQYGKSAGQLGGYFNLASGGENMFSGISSGNPGQAVYGLERALPSAERLQPGWFRGMPSGVNPVLAGAEVVGGTAVGLHGALHGNPLTGGAGLAVAGNGLAAFSPAIFAGNSFGISSAGLGGAAVGAGVGIGAGLFFDGAKRGGFGGGLESTAGAALTGFSVGGPVGAVIGAGVGAVASIFGIGGHPGAKEASMRADLIQNKLPNIMNKIYTLDQTNQAQADKELGDLASLLRVNKGDLTAAYNPDGSFTNQAAVSNLDEAIRGKHIHPTEFGQYDRPYDKPSDGALSVNNYKNREKDLSAGGVWDTRLDQEIQASGGNPASNSPACSAAGNGNSYGNTAGSSGGLFGGLLGGGLAGIGGFFGSFIGQIENYMSNLGASIQNTFANIFSQSGSNGGSLLSGFNIPGISGGASTFGGLNSLIPAYASSLGNNTPSSGTGPDSYYPRELSGPNADSWTGDPGAVDTNVTWNGVPGTENSPSVTSSGDNTDTANQNAASGLGYYSSNPSSAGGNTDNGGGILQVPGANTGDSGALSPDSAPLIDAQAAAAAP